MRINLRCCCTPQLVLGTVDVGETLVRDGQSIAFPLTNGSRLTLTVRTAFDGCVISPEMALYAQSDVVERMAGHRRELALYSNDTPLETVRLIPTFIEINEPVPIGGGQW